ILLDSPAIAIPESFSSVRRAGRTGPRSLHGAEFYAAWMPRLPCTSMDGPEPTWPLTCGFRSPATPNEPQCFACQAHHGSFGPEIEHGQGTLQSLGRMVPTECLRRCRISGVGHRHPGGPF